MPNARVIPFSAGLGREVRLDVYYPTHNQEFDTIDKFKKLWEFTIEQQKTIDAGCDVDTIIVLNGESKEMEDYFIPLDGAETKNGIFRVIKHDNTGESWGGFNKAFQMFKDEYDYWLFSEDDLIVLGDKYYQRAIDTFNSCEYAGFLALVGVSDNPKYPIHAYNGTGLTTRDILDKVCDVNDGHLPYPPKTDKHTEIILKGEIPFTNEIAKLGYKIVPIGEREWTEENLVLPYDNICQTLQ